MNDPYLAPVTLMAQHVTLAPLTVRHAEDLFAALDGDKELWAYLPWPHPETLDDMKGWIFWSLDMQAKGLRIPFSVIDNQTGRVIGSTSYIEPSSEHRHLDIGWTWYARSHWRSAVNTECKFALLRYAFETLGCIRVAFRADERNLRSQRAIERIGGVKEGVMRKAQILADGHERSVVYYSVLDDEWPARKAWFEERLAVTV